MRGSLTLGLLALTVILVFAAGIPTSADSLTDDPDAGQSYEQIQPSPADDAGLADASLQAPPALLFPWDKGVPDGIRYTGGPHGGGSVTPCVPISVTKLSGLDFGLSSQEVLAVAGGAIAGFGDGLSTGRGEGKYVAVTHPDGWQTEYWHLASITPNIKFKGLVIAQGTVLGISGKTTIPDTDPVEYAFHLHLELKRNGQPVGWAGKTINGWVARSTLVQSNRAKGFNYEGTMTQGTKSETAISVCGSTGISMTGSISTATADTTAIGTMLASANARKLQQVGNVTGKVVDASSGRAVAASIVYSGNGINRGVTADSGGMYTLTKVPVGIGSIQAAAAKFVTDTLAVVVPADATARADVVLLPKGSLQLAPPHAGTSAVAPREYFSKTVKFTYTAGPIMLFSKTSGSYGVGWISSDDEARVSVTRPDGSVARYTHYYGYPANCCSVVPTAPQDITNLFQPGVNTVTISLWDNRVGGYGTWGYYIGRQR